MWIVLQNAGPAAGQASSFPMSLPDVWAALNAPILAERGLGSNLKNPSGRYSQEQKLASQTTACVIAAISLISSCITLYWFAKMRKLFRHRLIMLLMFADIGRSFWIFVFTTTALSGTPVGDQTHICQATGYLTQVSIECADLAIFFIAIHSALQVFRVNTVNPDHGGLYPYRKWVFGIWAVLPVSAVALAFTNHESAAFNYNGLPICNLPVRPFWYRLALSWIPRYVILALIVCINVAIYIYARRGSAVSQFYKRHGSLDHDDATQLASLNPMSSSHTRGRPPTAPRHDDPNDTRLEFLTSSLDPGPNGFEPLPSTPTDEHMPRVLAADRIRKMSDGTTLVGDRSTRCNSTDNSFKLHLSPARHSSPIKEDQLDVHEEEEHRGPFSRRQLGFGAARHPLKTIQERRLEHNRRTSHLQFGEAESRARSETARRQLRVMFVYPIVYFMVWLIPFINHLLAYSKELVLHPIYALSFITWICVAGLGLVDSIVFTLRETPWRHIPGSDGTFWGSFCFWRHAPSSRRTSQAVISLSTHSEKRIRKQSSLLTLIQKRQTSTSGTAGPLRSPEPTHPAGTVAHVQGMDTWDFAPSSSASVRTPGRERYWFERQESFVVTDEDVEKGNNALVDKI